MVTPFFYYRFHKICNSRHFTKEDYSFALGMAVSQMIVSSDQDPDKVMALTFQQWKPVQRPPTGTNPYPRINSSHRTTMRGGYGGMTARNITSPNPTISIPTKPNPIPSLDLALLINLT